MIKNFFIKLLAAFGPYKLGNKLDADQKTIDALNAQAIHQQVKNWKITLTGRNLCQKIAEAKVEQPEALRQSGVFAKMNEKAIEKLLKTPKNPPIDFFYEDRSVLGNGWKVKH